MKHAIAFVAATAFALAPTATFAAPTSTAPAPGSISPAHETGQPGVECQDGGVAPSQSGREPGPGSPFQADSISGAHYAGEQDGINNKNTASESQYDIACFHPQH